MKIYFFLFLIVFLSFACTKNEENGAIAENSELAQKLRSYPETIQIDTQNYELSTFIWRDFFPPSEPNGSQLAALTQLIETDSLDIPKSFSLERVYIIKDNEIYTSKYETTEKSPSYILAGMVTNGPKWETNTKVDVVCVFKNEENNISYKIQAKSQLIHKTE
ncbi:hypothetical protein [Brumimicrobium oceani]|uniref:Uncharacterized protein n=1 Tax=Brumimicrobium oceani TaxID=2100725 RepID=A0A2U2XCG3_9FLAO|nr:hypothetical protein [Brumimicrobium oceani]PWH85482.1 hypothetical protein DIT68_09505 [Brumimicrobium oceani]